MSKAVISESRVDELRRSFDAVFSRPPAERGEETEDILAIQVAGDPYAIRLRDLDGIVADRRVVPVPGGHADFLGMAGLRGRTMPVFDLASLLGYPRGADDPRWMVLCGRDDAVALAFEKLDRYERLPRSSFRLEERTRPHRPNVSEVVGTPAGVLSVINLSPLVTAIRARPGRTRLIKEH